MLFVSLELFYEAGGAYSSLPGVIWVFRVLCHKHYLVLLVCVSDNTKRIELSKQVDRKKGC